ncbi:hypothetical protein D2E76_26455 [Mycobacteroides abscessus]|uniref:Uncharacterized protein n=1 Tax=Mycobacteroides abscessus TaxID=36809 RepID=A0ABD7HGL2_9MYCO|nr:hypothetical protein [Mycobacteroides abscessus]RIT28916.1 hypothetical protein D2E76_26455 [Mycobacteroides abscessus]
MNTTATTSQRQDARVEQLPLPLGADPDEVDDWQVNDDGSRYRHVWSGPADLPEGISDLDIRCVVTQYEDGGIAAEGVDGPEIYVATSSYSPTAAFLVALAIIKATTQALQWVAVGAK